MTVMLSRESFTDVASDVIGISHKWKWLQEKVCRFYKKPDDVETLGADDADIEQERHLGGDDDMETPDADDEKSEEEGHLGGDDEGEEEEQPDDQTLLDNHRKTHEDGWKYAVGIKIEKFGPLKNGEGKGIGDSVEQGCKSKGTKRKDDREDFGEGCGEDFGEGCGEDCGKETHAVVDP